MDKQGSFKSLFVILLITLVIAGFWDSVPIIKNAVHAVFDPTLGGILNLNLTIGMFIIVFLIAIITTLIQKYTTDQKAIKELKKEQKKLQEEMKNSRSNPDKFKELNAKNLEIMPKMFRLSMRPMIYTAIPFLLVFRWLMDYFVEIPFKFLGFLNWFWFYIVFAILFGAILRKYLDVA